jgi:CDP-paratose 2-epimerase
MRLKILVTGGCGFIGCNTARSFSKLNHCVTVLDDLSRRGSANNLEWLRRQVHTDFVLGSVCDLRSLSEIIKQGSFDVVVHLAGQVAVTSSVIDPRHDFEINALGTFNVLEAVRQHSPETMVLNASTNKVYGKLTAFDLQEEPTRYLIPDLPHGISEQQPIDFHSPYGCSKGAADQYVIDYARIYGLRTVNFRQSCIYGQRQFGVADQGWLAWFAFAHSLDQPVTIYGTGKQVRDVLFVDDLINCYLASIDRIDRVRGMTFNIGGGPENTLSLLELVEALQRHSGRAVSYTFENWRPSDQPVYVSDIRKAEALLGWKPEVGVDEGLTKLYSWVEANGESFLERATVSR